ISRKEVTNVNNILARDMLYRGNGLRSVVQPERRMEAFGHDLILLMAIDLVLFGLVRVIGWIDWNNGHGDTPLCVALPCTAAVIVAHIAASWIVFGEELLDEEMPLQVSASIVSGLLPVIGALWMLCTSWVSGHAHTVHGWNIMNTHVTMG